MAIHINPLFKKEISTLPGGEKLLQCYSAAHVLPDAR